MNSIRSYTLTTNEHFDIDIRQGDEDKIPFLVLKKSLDREQKHRHSLIVTAVDGGKPVKSGILNVYSLVKTLRKSVYDIFELDKITGEIRVKGLVDYEENDIYKLDVEASDRGTPPLTGESRVIIKVIDVNDNPPEIEVTSLTNTVQEDSKPGTVISLLSVTDKDSGVNGKVRTSLTSDGPFELKPSFKENIYSVVTKGVLDREEVTVYEVTIKANDCGETPMSTFKTFTIIISDVNDNKPQFSQNPYHFYVVENNIAGKPVFSIFATDKDTNDNAVVSYHILREGNQKNIMTFLNVNPDNGEISALKSFDFEAVKTFQFQVVATDSGTPSLSTFKTVSIHVADVNDNSPHFDINPLRFYLDENNIAGKSIFSVSATDNDINDNAVIAYHLVRDGSQKDITSFLNINSENGEISALKSFDFEAVKTFQFQVVATDSGTPSLSSNVTVHVFILDQNDNAPVILYPVSSNGSAEGVQEIPRNVHAGHLVTKVRAYDADIGYNGWLLFSLQDVSDHSLFSLDRYTGQIRTLRSFTETDEAEHKLLILVKDNGNVSLSATATVMVKVVEPKEAFAASDVQSAAKDDEDSDVTFYLMITLGAVSLLFVISIIVLIAMQCSKSTDYTSKYLQEPNYDGTLCHSIQYRSGDKRYMLVGPRMSIGSTIVPGISSFSWFLC
uniref:Si:ch73-379j16.2 n=1 Tax=Gouania willdenowi TaxID=441366 RepID=A0A8C5G2D8_GOUWI